MPTRKIASLPQLHDICRDPQHDPPRMMVFQPGVYEHQCPRCGAKQVFTVAGLMMIAEH